MLRYNKGSWHAVVAPGGVALLAPDVAAPVLEGMWTALTAGDGLGGVLESLVGAFGASLGSLPSFAVAIYDASTDEVRVMVRGPVNATVTADGSAPQQISGLGVTTWSERVISRPSTVDLTGAVESDVELPIRDGVVAAGRVRWAITASNAPHQSVSVTTFEPAPTSPVVTPSSRVVGFDETIAPNPGETHAELPVELPAVPAIIVPEVALGEAVTPSDPGITVAPVDAHDAVSDETTGYDDLIFGETRISTVEDAAVRVTEESSHTPNADLAAGLISVIPPTPARVIPAPTTPAPPAPPAPPTPPAPQALPARGDHDGETISAARLAELQSELARSAGSIPPPPLPTAAHAPTLIVSTGERLTLDRGAVIGRRPRAVRATGSVPHLVTVPSPNQDVSRSHIELRVEAGDVVATDLDTTNGTRLLRIGAEPVRLHPGESTLLVPGDRLDLGDEIVLAFEGLR